MRVAWLRARAPRADDPLDDIAALINALHPLHRIEVFTPDRFHAFLTAHARVPFDLAVYEIDSAGSQAALHPVQATVEGVVVLRTLGLPDVRRVVDASPTTVVHWQAVADDVRVQCPGHDVRVAVVGVTGIPGIPSSRPVQGPRSEPVTFGLLTPGRRQILERAIDREGLDARTAILLADRSPEEILRAADVIVSMTWPWTGQPATEALAAMAAGKPVVVLETPGTAEWPAFDPQSWRRRGPTSDPPIVVSIDPLDEEHSMGLALARLSTDAALRAQLGDAARAWWQAHATPEHAAADWHTILSDVAGRVCT